MALYSDGLSFHHSKNTKKLVEELGILLVKGCGYCPEMNCTEQLWKVVKHEYKFQLMAFLSMHPARLLDLEKMVGDIMAGSHKLDFEATVRRIYLDMAESVGANVE